MDISPTTALDAPHSSFQRLISKNCFSLFGMRDLFRRLIRASLRKRNGKSMHMQKSLFMRE